MTKLNYPSDGIYKYCRLDIESALNKLSLAYNGCILDVPSGFTYRSYLSGLGNTINNFNKELQSISYHLEKSTNNFEILSENLSDKVKKMEGIKIKERDRMIVS